MVELLVRAQSHDDQVVANAISCLCGLLEPLQLSLCNPHLAAQQAAQQAAGRPAASAAVPAPHGSAHQHGGVAAHSGSGGSGGSLGRTVSMRSFC